jgi:hypothetical protein
MAIGKCGPGGKTSIDKSLRWRFVKLQGLDDFPLHAGVARSKSARAIKSMRMS